MAARKSKQVQVSVDTEVHEAALAVLGELGFTFSAAVQVFERAVVRENGIPFCLSLGGGRMVEYATVPFERVDDDD